MDVFVGGERFDALQVGVRVLWEIKTHQFDSYNDFIQNQEIEKEIAQLTKGVFPPSSSSSISARQRFPITSGG